MTKISFDAQRPPDVGGVVPKYDTTLWHGDDDLWSFHSVEADATTIAGAPLTVTRVVLECGPFKAECDVWSLAGVDDPTDLEAIFWQHFPREHLLKLLNAVAEVATEHGRVIGQETLRRDLRKLLGV